LRHPSGRIVLNKAARASGIAVGCSISTSIEVTVRLGAVAYLVLAVAGVALLARLMLQFRGSVITSDGGLLAYRELDDALALAIIGGEILADARTGKNARHQSVGLLRQSVFGRLAGYEDVNDAERLCRDPAMRWVVGGRAPMGQAASASQRSRFETEWLTGRRTSLLLLICLASGSTRCRERGAQSWAPLFVRGVKRRRQEGFSRYC
jgi:hypothetical protein